MPNPMFSTRTTSNQVSPSNPLNQSGKKYRSKHNSFNYSRDFYNTLRYADVTPHEVIEGVEGDKISISSKHNIRTHTLSSVLLSDVFMKKSYFAVDMKAILPNNWNKVYTNPSQGDDIPDYKVNTVINGLPSLLSHFFDKYSNYLVWAREYYSGVDLTEYSDNFSNFMTYNLRMLLFFEMFFSDGSLLSSLGCHLSSFFKVVSSISDEDVKYNFDDFFDRCIYLLDYSVSSNDVGLKITYDISDTFTITKYYYPDPTSAQSGISFSDMISLRQLLDIFRDHSEAKIDFVFSDQTVATKTVYEFISQMAVTFSNFTIVPFDNYPLNYARVCAYQLVCSQFYTNDKVDHIFSAHDYLDNQKSIYNKIISETSGDPAFYMSFEMNGTYYEYDVLSGFVLEYILNQWPVVGQGQELSYFTDNKLDVFMLFVGFMDNLFSYRRSLRYGDYFTGARTQPYAVGDINAPVTAVGVSAIDTTRSILRQRFFNLVERIGSRWEDYIRDVTDGTPAPDVTIPRFLSSDTSSVRGFEVENTADNQGNIVTILNSSNSNYVYEIEVGQPCIILGLTHFEVPRVYSKTIDRFFFHTNRFEMFNKFMQYTGDQMIGQAERFAVADVDRPFGYTLRHMEYKQRYPIASGGFVKYLPSWLFVTDNNQGQNDTDAESYELCPDYVHSHNSEFDRFYESLTGYSLGSYFHFILKYENNVKASRQMDYAPTIL